MRWNALVAMLSLAALSRCSGRVEQMSHDPPAPPDSGLDAGGLSDADASGPLDAGPTACVPGQSAGCACTSGASGAQTCLADGSYGMCVCQGSDAAVSKCVPGASSGCTCANGGPGAQVCELDGSLGPCQCGAAEVGPSGCVPGQSTSCTCVSGLPGAQLCQGNGSYGPCICDPDAGSWEQQRLAWLRAGVVGTWVGMVKNPWQPAFTATVVLEASGHYSAHSPGDTSVVFYYGTNDDTPEKKYDINDVTANGEGWGEIVISWGYPGSTNIDKLHHIALSDDLNKLSFETWHQNSYGPIVLTLSRQK